MPTREATCHCGELRVTTQGEPLLVTICHCLACQRRTGSAFGAQSLWDRDRVRVSGQYTDYTRVSDEADRKEHVFHFCPACGSPVFHTAPSDPELVVVSVGSFADPTFPAPNRSGYDSRRHPWVRLPEAMHLGCYELWEPAGLLYDEGRHAEAADRGRAILAAHPAHAAYLHFNIACCESLAGRPAEAVHHLAEAIAGWERYRELAATDSDFDAIRGDETFVRLVGAASA